MLVENNDRLGSSTGEDRRAKDLDFQTDAFGPPPEGHAVSDLVCGDDGAEGGRSPLQAPEHVTDVRQPLAMLI
jgi:hypothetical protein